MPFTSTPSTNLVELLLEAFPQFSALSDECWITGAVEENQWDFGPEIVVATRLGGRPDVIRRLREEHPVNRSHREEHDDRMLTVFTEVEAFAWAADVAHLGSPRFITREGAPDLQVGDWWIEAKTVERSAQAREVGRQERPLLKQKGFTIRHLTGVLPPSDGLLRKFQSQLEDSLKKWDRQARSGHLAVFYNLEMISSHVERQRVRDQVCAWAEEAESRSEATVVVAYNWQWQTPLYDSDSVHIAH